jgi:hypothetical protein
MLVLPREKTEVFETVVRRWECTYAMMSVALDGALTFRARGELVRARQQVSMSADLLSRLSASLTSFCTTLATRGRRIAELPAVEPLATQFFRGNTAQSAASWNAILHHVVVRGRSRFFHKVRILSSTLEQLQSEFQEAAEDIAKGLCVKPYDAWKKLDQLHYDFNTCLREAEILLKSFLRVLPAGQLPALASELDAPPEPRALRMKPRFSRSTA